jgi:hypothetical protein
MVSQSIDVMKLHTTTVKLHSIVVKLPTTIVKLQTVVVKFLSWAPKLLRMYRNCVVRYVSCSGARHISRRMEGLAGSIPLFL